MEEIEVNGVSHIQAVNNQNLLCRSSSGGVSETSHIIPIRINLLELDIGDPASIILCDSPGYDDNRGKEIDIANGYGIFEAACQAKSVRLAVILSMFSIGDKLDKLKEMISILSKLFPNIQQHFKSVQYFFTKFDEKLKGQINQRLRDKLSTLSQEEKNESKTYVKLLNDLINKTKKKKDILTINPLEDDRVEIINSLLELDPIEKPNEKFKPSITE